MNRSLIFALALSSGVVAGAPVLAAPSGPQAAKVSYGDLDLSSAAGSRVLDKRIESALRRVCDYNPQERQPALRSASVRCMAAARADIVLPEGVVARVASR